MSRIFISHSNRDNARALEVRNWLTSNGWNDVFLDVDPTDGLAPGERWQNALKAAADRCEAVLFLISPNWLASAWCLSEFLLAKQLGKRLFPVLVDGASLEKLPVEISSDHQAVDLIGDIKGWERLKEGLRRAGLDANSFLFPEGRRPYPGFEPLTENDAAIFFGREAQIIRGLDRLRLMRDAGAERMMVVLGASGAGKSSFLRAGLWPRLRRDDRNFLPLPTIRPERAVLSGKSGLFAALEKTLADPRIASRAEITSFPRARGSLADLAGREDGLAGLLSAIRRAGQTLTDGSPPAVVLLVDQAEELLNDEGRAEAEQFMRLIAQTLDLDKELIVIFAIRSDAYPQLQAKPALASVPREPFDLPPMPEGSLRLVIEGPAKIATPSLKLDPALVDALLTDAKGQDALPLLAFTLDRLAREYGAEGKLTLDNYVRSGGLRGVITAAVEEALADGRRRGLVPPDAQVLEGLLKQAFIPHLARVNEAGEFARRIANIHEIPTLAAPLINLLVDARLLTRDRDQDGETVEVAHEALLREWPLLRGFLEADREFLVSKRQIADDLQIWEQAPPAKKSDALLTGLRLTRAQQFLSERSAQDLTDEERAFIGASVKSADAAKRRRNVVVAAVIALLIAFSGLAATQWINATREARVAQENKQEALRSADDSRKARDQAEENARRAETNEAKARGAQVRAQIQESASLADQAVRQAENGDVLDAIRTAYGALPHDPAKLDRPFVAKADFALAKAFLANHLEKAITPTADWVNALSMNADGSRVAIGTRDGYFKLYNASTYHELVSANERRQAVMALAYSGDGSRIVVAYQSPPSLVVRDGTSGEVLRSVRLTATPHRILVTRDGSRVVVFSQDAEPRPFVVDVGRGGVSSHPLESNPVLRGSYVIPRAVSMSDDERWLLEVGFNGVFIWNLETGRLATASVDAGPNVHKLDFSKTEGEESIVGGVFVKGGHDVLLTGYRFNYVVDASTGVLKSNYRFTDKSRFVAERGPLVLSDGKRSVVVVNKRTIAVHSLVDGEFIESYGLPSDITKIAASPDGRVLIVVCADLLVRAFSIGPIAPIATFFGHTERISDVKFTPDSNRLMTYGDKTFRVWNLKETADQLDMLPANAKVLAVDDKSSVAYVVQKVEEDARQAGRGTARAGIWDISKGRLLDSDTISDFSSDATQSRFSPSGKWLALLNLYDPGDSEERHKALEKVIDDLKRDGNAKTQFKVGSNDEHLAAAMIVDAQTGKVAEFSTLNNPSGNPSVSFLGDDGVTIGLTYSSETASFAEVWNARTGNRQLSASQSGTGARTFYSDATNCMVFVSERGSRMYTASFWNVATGVSSGQFERPLIADLASGSAAAPLWHGDRVLLGDENVKPMLSECSTGKEIGSVAGVSAGASGLLMSGDRRRMLVDGVGTSRSLWDLQNSRKISEVPDQEFDGSIARFSEDSQRVVTRGRRGNKDTIQIFDAMSGKLLKSFPEEPETLEYYVGWTGKRLAVRLDDRTFEIRDVESGAAPVRIVLDAKLRRWRFTASDERLVTVDETGKLNLWDVHSGASIFERADLDKVEPLGGAQLRAVRVPLLLAAGDVLLLDTIKGAIVETLPRVHQINGLLLSPNEQSVVVIQPDEIGLYRLEPAERVAFMPVAANEQAFFGFSESGEEAELFVRGPNGAGAIRLFNMPDGKQVGQFGGVEINVMAPDGSLAFVSGNTLSIWHHQSGSVRKVNFARQVLRVDCDPSSHSLSVMTADFKVWAVELAAGDPKLVGSFSTAPKWIRPTSDSDKFVIYETSNKATLRDTSSGKVLTDFPSRWSTVTSTRQWIECFDPAGELVAIRSPDNFVRVYRVSNGSKVTEFNWDDNAIVGISFSSDSKRLLIVSDKGRFSNWDIQAGKAAPAPSLGREYSSYAPVTLKRTLDPSQMLAISKQGYVDLYSMNTNSVQTFYSGQPEEDLNAALSPNGGILATIGSGDVLRLWHVGARDVLARIPIKNDYPVTTLRFSSDGAVLVVGGNDKTTLVRMPLVGDPLLKATAELIGSERPPSANTAASNTPRLGIIMRDVSPDEARQKQLPSSQGAEVIEVISGSPAQAAGIRVGDVITKVNGTAVTTATESSGAIKNIHLDLTLEIERGSVVMTTRAALPD